MTLTRCCIDDGTRSLRPREELEYYGEPKLNVPVIILTMYRCYFSTVALFLVAGASALSTEPLHSVDAVGQSCRRRDLLKGAFGLATSAAAAATFHTQPASAFENKISNKYDDRPKRRGPQPKDLGIGTRTTAFTGEEYVGLKSCGAAPNCFSSTITLEDDLDHSIPPWTWPTSLENQQAAFEELRDVLLAYTPGQNGVDGGGFEIKTFDPKNGYIYVQYESLKNGYIDDVEMTVIPGREDDPRTVHVRSSSRIGYLDFGVNGKRLNYIASSLRAKGWKAEGVDYKTHAFYASENERV